jgi:thiaminase/transcriptional activator TenA
VSLTAILRTKCADIWRRESEHPFVRGLGDGTLQAEQFTFYLVQDYLFLAEYSRVFALAVAKAPDLATMELFSGLLSGTLIVEMQLHRDYCRRLGIADSMLAGALPAPVTHGYTTHLLSVAFGGTLTEIIAAVLPCQLGYAEIAAQLARQQGGGGNPFYAEWIAMYTSDEFVQGAGHLAHLLDELSSGLPTRHTDQLETVFLTSSRYEYLFWEMSWNHTGWPI